MWTAVSFPEQDLERSRDTREISLSDCRCGAGRETLHAPDPHEPFVEGDVVWIVGESVDVYKLVGRKCEGFDMG